MTDCIQRHARSLHRVLDTASTQSQPADLKKLLNAFAMQLLEVHWLALS